MQAVCPKCGAEKTGEACPRCGLVFAKFDPKVLERDIPKEMKDLWQLVSESWEDEATHERFVEQALASSLGDYAARCYRERAGDPTADRHLKQIQERLALMATSLAQVMAGSKSDVKPRKKSPISTAVMLLIFLLVLGGFSVAILAVLK